MKIVRNLCMEYININCTVGAKSDITFINEDPVEWVEHLISSSFVLKILS